MKDNTLKDIGLVLVLLVIVSLFSCGRDIAANAPAFPEGIVCGKAYEAAAIQHRPLILGKIVFFADYYDDEDYILKICGDDDETIDFAYVSKVIWRYTQVGDRFALNKNIVELRDPERRVK